MTAGLLGLPVGGITALVANRKAGLMAVGGSALFGLIRGAYDEVKHISSAGTPDQKMSDILKEVKNDREYEFKGARDKEAKTYLAALRKIAVDDKPEKHSLTIYYDGKGTGIICINTKSPEVIDKMDKQFDSYLKNSPKSDYRSVENKNGYVVSFTNISSGFIYKLIDLGIYLSVNNKGFTINCLTENTID